MSGADEACAGVRRRAHRHRAEALRAAARAAPGPEPPPLRGRCGQPYGRVRGERRRAATAGSRCPQPELRTAPFPATATVSRNVAGAKSADTVAPGATVTLQRCGSRCTCPSSARAVAPRAGVAVSARCWPAFQVVVQLDEHSRPGTSAETEPGPDDAERQAAPGVSSRTSHGESCVSSQAPECP